MTIMGPAGKELRIALLIDADNAPAAKIDRVLTELSTLGVINVRRAYGNWTRPGLVGWQDKLLEHAIRPIQQFDYSTRKNATDMAMTVDAMELLYADGPDAFGIVSSDADFTPLVMHLRSKGAAVYGFGAAHTPKPFVNACSRFLYLEALGEAPGTAVAASENAPAPGVPNRPAASRVPAAQLRQNTHLMALLRDAVDASCDESGWAAVGAVGAQIANRTSFDARNHGYPTLSKLLCATEVFDVRDEGTSRIAVRDRRHAMPSGPSASPVVPFAPQTQASTQVKVLESSVGRKPRPAITRPGIHALRSLLSMLALQRVSAADILVLVPELVSGEPCAMAGVCSRLRQGGVLHPGASGLRLFERKSDVFGLMHENGQAVAVRYLG